MPDSEPIAVRALCMGCGGAGKIRKPRLFLSQAEPRTVIESGRCPHCRDASGLQPRFEPPV